VNGSTIYDLRFTIYALGARSVPNQSKLAWWVRPVPWFGGARVGGEMQADSPCGLYGPRSSSEAGTLVGTAGQHLIFSSIFRVSVPPQCYIGESCILGKTFLNHGSTRIDTDNGVLLIRVYPCSSVVESFGCGSAALSLRDQNPGARESAGERS